MEFLVPIGIPTYMLNDCMHLLLSCLLFYQIDNFIPCVLTEIIMEIKV